MRSSSLRISAFACVILAATATALILTRGRPVAVSLAGHAGSAESPAASPSLGLGLSAAHIWGADPHVRSATDLAEMCGVVLDLWNDQITVDQYVDQLFERGGRASPQAIELANVRRDRHPHLFPTDSEWSNASPEDQLRAFFRYTWSAHSPVEAFDADSVEAWTGQEREIPSGVKGAQGMLARCTPPGMSLADMQKAKDTAWMRVHAQFHEHSSEHVIDFKFIFDPGTKRWFPAEVRIYGDRTDFNWAI